MGTQPGSLKLNRQTMGKGGLSRRGRACDHNKFRSFLLRDLRRDLRDLLLLQRLLNQYHFMGITLGNLIIQCSYCLDFLHISPLGRFFQYLEEFCLRHKGFHPPRLFPRRHQKQKTIIIKL